MARIFIAYDHRGIETARRIIQWCVDNKHKPVDMGPETEDSVDYPDFAVPATEQTVKFRGRSATVLICGWGNGMAIAANKVVGARAALCMSRVQAEYARSHNNANVLVMSAEGTGWGMMEEILGAFMNTKFSAGRHLRRVNKISRHETEKGHRSKRYRKG